MLCGVGCDSKPITRRESFETQAWLSDESEEYDVHVRERGDVNFATFLRRRLMLLSQLLWMMHTARSLIPVSFVCAGGLFWPGRHPR